VIRASDNYKGIHRAEFLNLGQLQKLISVHPEHRNSRRKPRHKLRWGSKFSLTRIYRLFRSKTSSCFAIGTKPRGDSFSSRKSAGQARREHTPEGRLRIQNCSVVVSNLDEILIRASKFLKAQVIEFYVRVAPLQLPYRRDRPVTLKRVLMVPRSANFGLFL
jgi:hypothetical protein